jgi:hypothetical protein
VTEEIQGKPRIIGVWTEIRNGREPNSRQRYYCWGQHTRSFSLSEVQSVLRGVVTALRKNATDWPDIRDSVLLILPSLIWDFGDVRNI